MITNGALARGLVRYGYDRLGPADWVTLTRASLAVGVAALVADSFDRPAPVTLLVALTAVALALDAVDGWIARRTGTASPLGAHFDGEVDAFLIARPQRVRRQLGGRGGCSRSARRATRSYAAGWVLPWMRAPLPRRDWRKVVAATQGIVLAVAAADVLPLALTQAVLLAALALLAESFGRDVVVAVAPPQRHARSGGEDRRPGGRRAAPLATPGRAGQCARPRGPAHDARPAARVGRPRRAEPARVV